MESGGDRLENIAEAGNYGKTGDCFLYLCEFCHDTWEVNTVMCCIMTLLSMMMDNMYDGGPIRYDGAEKFLSLSDAVAVITSRNEDCKMVEMANSFNLEWLRMTLRNS